MASLSRAELDRAIKGILKDADLSKLSSKKVRRSLEEKHGLDLTARKQEIDDLVMKYVDEMTSQQEPENGNDASDSNESETEQNGNSAKSDSDDSASDFDEPDDMGPPQKKVKKMKKNASPTSVSKKTDADLAKSLQEEENSGGRRSTRSGKSPRSTSEKKTKEPKTGKSRKGTGYGKLCRLSPALSDLLGVEKMARSDVVKRMWEIVKERDLADPRNRQFMICDDQLMPIFKRKRVKTFGMMKYLKDHIFDPGEYEEMIS